MSAEAMTTPQSEEDTSGISSETTTIRQSQEITTSIVRETALNNALQLDQLLKGVEQSEDESLRFDNSRLALIRNARNLLFSASEVGKDLN